MATIEHSALTSGELHEPKGIASADPNTVYVADGAGSGDWRAFPNGFCGYSSPTGTAVASGGSFTLVNVATGTSGVQREFSHNSAGRLTYTGAATMGVKIDVNLSGQASAATSLDVAIAKNGIPEFYVSSQTSATNEIVSVSCTAQVNLATNDYFEVYLQTASGDFVVENFHLSVEGRI